MHVPPPDTSPFAAAVLLSRTRVLGTLVLEMTVREAKVELCHIGSDRFVIKS